MHRQHCGHRVHLYAVWNNWNLRRTVVNMTPESWTRTPLVLARSLDEGKTWVDHTVLENAPDHGYCCTAMLKFLH